jgi:Ca2+/Na+ antiporter
MAAGTSGPELFTAAIGAFYPQDDLGVATVIGSGTCHAARALSCRRGFLLPVLTTCSIQASSISWSSRVCLEFSVVCVYC